MFDQWMNTYRSILKATLGWRDDKADRMIAGIGAAMYRSQFNRGLTPQQCVDDDLICWNE